jgi:hypothetical protein
VRERFGPYAHDFAFESASLSFSFESLQAMGEFFQSSGPRQSSVPDERREELLVEMLALVNEHNKADDGSVAIDSPYLIAVARRKS